MRTVWKFPLDVSDRPTTVKVPHLAKPVHVGLDPATGQPAVWIELYDDQPKAEREYKVHGTGHPTDDSGTHVGAVIQGIFVWHGYERRL